MQRLRRRFAKGGVGLVAIVAALLLLAGTALAVLVTWTGQGATGGFCNNVQQDPSVPAGKQQWLFVLRNLTLGRPGR